MNSELVALLALQDDDDAIAEVEEKLADFQPQLTALDRALQSALAEQARAAAALAAAEKQEHELQARMDEQKQLHERSLAQLDSVKKVKEAAAATTQAEITSRVLHEIEGEVQHAVARVVDLRKKLTDADAELQRMRETQSEARSAIDSQVADVRKELDAALEKRQDATAAVPAALLAKYERIRSKKKVRAVFQVDRMSCGNCDTALPMQRRNVMLSTGSIEACEACGVLLYAGE